MVPQGPRNHYATLGGGQFRSVRFDFGHRANLQLEGLERRRVWVQVTTNGGKSGIGMRPLVSSDVRCHVEGEIYYLISPRV